MQTLNSTLSSLYAHLNASDGVVSIGWEESQEWQDGALDSLIDWGLLKPAPTASLLECFGCEYRCYQEVLVLPSKETTRAFIVCDVAEKMQQMGRINVPLERLNQWQCSALQVAQVMQGLLGLAHELRQGDADGSVALGMLKGKKGRRWVTLKIKPLRLEINQTEMLIKDVLFVDGGVLSIDRVRINDLVNAAERRQGKIYQTSTEKREARKSKTEALHQSWRDAYLNLKQKNPIKSDTWCAMQIEKMEVAQGRVHQTIRKNMK